MRFYFTSIFSGYTFAQNAQSNQDNLKVYSKFDFVPGDEVIFEDNLTSEQDGEFPSKWDLTKEQLKMQLLMEAK